MKPDFTNEELHEIEKAMDWFAGTQMGETANILSKLGETEEAVRLGGRIIDETVSAYCLRRAVSAKVRQYFEMRRNPPEMETVGEHHCMLCDKKMPKHSHLTSEHELYFINDKGEKDGGSE